MGELVGRWISETLAAVRPEDRAEAPRQISEAVLAAIGAAHPAARDPQRGLSSPVERLAAIEPLDPTGTPIPIRRPLTPLRDTVLMTNARDQPGVGREIEAEIGAVARSGGAEGELLLREADAVETLAAELTGGDRD